MSKRKPSRIATLETKVKELTYYIGAIKNRSDLMEKTMGEYIEYRGDWKKFNKYVDKKKKMFDKTDE